MSTQHMDVVGSFWSSNVLRTFALINRAGYMLLLVMVREKSEKRRLDSGFLFRKEEWEI